MRSAAARHSSKNVKSVNSSHSWRRNLILRAARWCLNSDLSSSEQCSLSDTVSSKGKLSRGQRCGTVSRLCWFSGRRDGHGHSDSYCATYPYASLSGAKWERAPLYSAWGLARSTGGWTVWGKPLLYDARRWVSEHWVTRHTGVRGRTGLRPRHTRARFLRVRQSGKGRDKIGKNWHQVRLLLQEQTDINSEAGDMRTCGQ